MNWTQIISILIWMTLAILNIISLFIPACGFFNVCNWIFGVFNATMVIALIPMVWKAIRDKKYEKWVEM